MPRMHLEQPDGSYPRFLQRLAKVNVLVPDNWELAPLSPAGSREPLEVLDDRTQTRSTVVARQLAIAQWPGMIGDPTPAGAVLVRLVHRTYKVTLNGESMRKLASAGEKGSCRER